MCQKVSNVRCSMCYTTGTGQHFDLPVFGSEGVYLCLTCRSIVCDHICDLSMVYMRKRRDDFVAKRNVLVVADTMWDEGEDASGDVNPNLIDQPAEPEPYCPHCGSTGEEWLRVSGGDGCTGKPCPHCSVVKE